MIHRCYMQELNPLCHKAHSTMLFTSLQQNAVKVLVVMTKMQVIGETAHREIDQV